MKKIKVIILAGGIGKRMWPIKASKSLLPFFGEPLILHTLKTVKKAGLNDFIVVANPANFNQIKSLTVPFKAQVVLQPKPKSLGDAVLRAAKLIKAQQPILVVNANDIFDPKLVSQIIKEAKKGRDDVIIPGLAVKEYFPGGYLKVERNRLIKIVEKPSPGKESSNLVKLVVDYFKNADDLLRILPKTLGKRVDGYEVAINQMAKKGFKVRVVKYKDYWGSIKYPWDVLKAMELFFKYRLPKKKGKKPSVARSASIIGPVIFEEGVKIFEGAKIKGPAYIGAGTIIGNNALIRESMIGRNCVIGYSAEVARSYIGDDCEFHASYVGDSVLGNNLGIGFGTVLANFRFDGREITSMIEGEKIATGMEKLGVIIGDNVRVGANASIMPGVKIGSDSFVGAGIVLYKDLLENKFCLLKQSFSVTRNKKLVVSGSREKYRKKI